jgi:hypothetical protein
MQAQRVIIYILKFKRISNQDKLMAMCGVSNILCLDVDQYINIMILGEDQPTEQLPNIPVNPCLLKRGVNQMECNRSLHVDDSELCKMFGSEETYI